MTLGKPSRFEIYLASSVSLIVVLMSVRAVQVQNDPYFFPYVLTVLVVVLGINYLASSVVHYVPFIPRAICTVSASFFLLLFPGVSLSQWLALAVLATLVIAYWCWRLFSATGKSRPLKWPALVATIGSAGLVAAFPLSDLSFGREGSSAVVSVPRSAGSTSNAFSTFTYGSGNDKRRQQFATRTTLITRDVDVSSILPGWNGFSGWYRTHYWGFDKTRLPLNATVWLPQGEGPFPLVLVNHGDHAMQDFSDGGYDYLATSLVQEGYIVAVLDNNFLNRSWSDLLLTQSLTGPGEIRTRATLTVEHLRAFAEWNREPSTPLFNKVDLDKVAVVGHSRGGEAVAHVPNLLRKDEEMSEIAVRTVIGIAPVDAYYWPNGNPNQLQDTNYMVLHGSLDGEMYFAGLGQYSRTNVVGGPDLTKVAIYIDGANHGQFNSSWGRCDNEFFSPLCTRFNLKSLIPEEMQQGLAKELIRAFLELTLRHDESYRAYFSGDVDAPQRQTATRMKVQFQDASTNALLDFEGEDSTRAIEARNLAHSSIDQLHVGARAHHVKWTDCAGDCWVEYRLEGAASVLALDVANKLDAKVDFSIEVAFTDGARTRASLGDVQLLEEAYTRSLNKFDYLRGNRSSEAAFETYFREIGPNSGVESVRLVFDRSTDGSMYIDNVALR